METRIIELLTANTSLEETELISKLELKGAEEFAAFNEAVNKLINDYAIYKTKREKYMLIENSHFKKGKIEITRSGNGFLLQPEPEGDVFVAAKNLNEAMNGDIVLVELARSTGKKAEGKVIKVLKRAFEYIVGTVAIKDDKVIVVPADRKIFGKFEIMPDHNLGAVEGDVVKCKMMGKNQDNGYNVVVFEVVANHNDPDKDMLMIMAKHNVEAVFNDEVLEQAKTVPTEVDPDHIMGRTDLREELIFTIDGDDTKDIDDAISLSWHEKGYVLGVHIADVANYVLPGTPIDETAMSRGTSVYLVDRVVPMLPKVLSNGICSLNPNVDRLAMSVSINLDLEGNVLDYHVFESIIRSRKQCTYGNVNEILENNNVPAGYEELSETILKMNELALKLRKKMERRGYIEFESDEVKFKLDENNKILEIIKREQHSGEKLIENYMILANECIATYLRNEKMPSVYRVHDLPSPEKIKEFMGYVALLGYNIKGLVKADKDHYTSLDVQALMHSIQDKPEFPVLSDLLLRSMKKAIYTTENIGHFGLGSPCYTHFTSPIRRYPDTTIHRLLKMVLRKDNVDKVTLLQKLVYITELSSQKEQGAVECEREVDDMKMAEYMEDHVGEIFDGMIVSVHPFGMFVKLDNLVEGLIAIDKMEGHFTFVEESKMLVSGKKKYRLGDDVKVKCTAASKVTREIDFEVVTNEQTTSTDNQNTNIQ